MFCFTKSVLEYSVLPHPKSVTPPGLDVARDKDSPHANKYAWIVQSHPLIHSCCNCIGPSAGNSEDIGGKGLSEMSVACQFFMQMEPSDKMKALYRRSWPHAWHGEQLWTDVFFTHLCTSLLGNWMHLYGWGRVTHSWGFSTPKSTTEEVLRVGCWVAWGNATERPSLHNRIFLSAFIPEGEVNIIGPAVILSWGLRWIT